VLLLDVGVASNVVSEVGAEPDGILKNAKAGGNKGADDLSNGKVGTLSENMIEALDAEDLNGDQYLSQESKTQWFHAYLKDGLGMIGLQLESGLERPHGVRGVFRCWSPWSGKSTISISDRKIDRRKECGCQTHVER
jgi:hypothetical protein